MKVTTHATRAPKVKKTRDIYLASALAGVFVVMLVSQLFTFEDFAPIFQTFDMMTESSAKVLAAVIVVAELFALPFLLRMNLSPALRIVSMASGWLVASAWLYMAVYTTVLVDTVSSVGLLGDVIPIPPGVVAVFATGLIAAAVVWATSALWPGVHRQPTAKK